MKHLILCFCLIACAAAAQRLDSMAFVVRRSSGFAQEGTVLYPGASRNDFTNGPLHLKFGEALHPLVTNVFTIGAVAVTNVQEMFDVAFLLRDARSGKVFRYNLTNQFYVCGDEFAFLAITNLSADAAGERIVCEVPEPSLPPAFAQCADLTNTLSLAEAQARGIGIDLQEVLTLEIEPDELGRATAVIRRRWVFASEPFGERIPAPAAAW